MLHRTAPRFLRGGRWSGRWRGVLLGSLVGGLAAAGLAIAQPAPDMHVAALWNHGARVDSGGDLHPTLESTDGNWRRGSASYQWCFNNQHGWQAEYIHQHVHQDLDMDHWLAEAHIGSEQTALAHHDHADC
jgi:hypothetical protein